MAEDPRFVTHFNTWQKFQEKLKDGTINPNRHIVFIKDEVNGPKLWCRGVIYSDMAQINQILSDVTNLTTNFDELSGKVLVLETGSKVTTSVNPSVIYKNNATSVTVTATFSASDSSLTPTSISIMQGSTNVVSANNAKTTNKAVSLNTTNNTTTYKSTAVVKGVTLTHSIDVNARYPIYYGFSTSKPTSFTGLNKVSATTTASREYSGTCTANNSKFYVLIPNDITVPSTFTMGGAPFVMDKSNATIDGVSYTILESGGTYNNTGKVNVKM